MTRAEAENILQQKFGLPFFYEEQWEAISRLLKGERILMVQRTGFGKSLVFQFAGMMLQGTTVIFSPLIALMREQVNKLKALGLPAAYINSTLTPEEKADVLRNAENGRYKLLYIVLARKRQLLRWARLQNSRLRKVNSCFSVIARLALDAFFIKHR